MNPTHIRTIFISATGIVPRQLGQHMKALGVDNMLPLIQTAALTDACHKVTRSNTNWATAARTDTDTSPFRPICLLASNPPVTQLRITSQ
jgi:hypothetical protein